MRYKWKAIVSFKIFRLLIVIVLWIGMMASLNYKKNIQKKDSEEILLLLRQYRIANKYTYEMEINSINNYENSVDKREKENWISFYKWNEKSLKSLIELGEKKGCYSDEFQEQYRRYNMILNLQATNTFWYFENKNYTFNNVFKVKLNEHGSSLKLDTLPFDISLFANQGAILEEGKRKNQKMNELIASFNFDEYDGKVLSNEKGSPYTFLSVLFGSNDYFSFFVEIGSLCWSICLIMYWNNNNSIKAEYLLPVTRKKIWIQNTKYFISSFCSILLIGILTWFSYWGIKYGFSGLFYNMYSAFGNFTGLKTYEHSNEYTYLGISKVYYNYIIPSGMGEFKGVTHVYSTVSYAKFIFLFAVLGILKIIFYSVLGSAIGFLTEKNRTKLVLSTAVLVIIMFGKTLGLNGIYNPFGIGNCWMITNGGSTYTWLTAVITYVIWILVIVVLVVLTIEKKDCD